MRAKIHDSHYCQNLTRGVIQIDHFHQETIAKSRLPLCVTQCHFFAHFGLRKDLNW